LTRDADFENGTDDPTLAKKNMHAAGFGTGKPDHLLAAHK